MFPKSTVNTCPNYVPARHNYISLCTGGEVRGGGGYRSNSIFASSMSSQPRSTGSIPESSVDHVVGTVSEGITLCIGRCIVTAGGVIPLNALPPPPGVENLSSGEVVFAAVLANISR